MKVFVGISYGTDHETIVVGASEVRESARRMVEQSRNETLYWAREATDGPDGGAGLDDHRGDLVGHVLAFDVAGSASLDWHITEHGELQAASTYHDEGQPLCYHIVRQGTEWVASFEGAVLCRSCLEECMTQCRKAEDDAMLEAVQSSRVDEADGGECATLLRRMLNPEDMGLAVTPYVRDEIRKVLGMPGCEVGVKCKS